MKKNWSQATETELSLIVKDWLKVQGKTQADLREGLKASSSRMPSILEELQKEYKSGGLPKLVSVLCEIEANWKEGGEAPKEKNIQSNDPYNQMDLLLQEILDDYNQ